MEHSMSAIITRTPDPLDEANELAASYPLAGIAAAAAACAREHHEGFDGHSCIECGEEIPPQRLARGRIRCVPSQEDLEQAQRRANR
jgi:RNA polymerase-binding transcription factor DksA